jgi:transcriptional adapter 2-alpha
MEVLDFAIFSPDWAADEELALLEGCEKYGLGNWEQIAEHIGSKTKEECNEHYRAVYLATPEQVPDMDLEFDKDVSRRALREAAIQKAAAQAAARKIPKQQKVGSRLLVTLFDNSPSNSSRYSP